jgi:hypothetical protein
VRVPEALKAASGPGISRRQVRLYIRAWKLDDAETARLLGVEPGLVAAARAEMRELARRHQRDLDRVHMRELALTGPLLAEARELAALMGHTGSLGELVLDVVRSAVAGAVYEQLEARRLIAATSSGDRRSADGTTSRSRSPAEAIEGESGRKGPESTATARRRESTSRTGRGSGAARVSDG